MATEIESATPDDSGADTTVTETDSSVENQATGTEQEDNQTTDTDVNGDTDSDSDSATNTDTDDSGDNDDFSYDDVMSEYSEFNVPENTDQTLVDSILKDLAPVFDAIAADQEDAQLLLDRELARMNSESQQSTDEWAVQLKQWEQDISADKEVGGENLEQSKGLVNAAFKQFGNKEVREIFNDTGLDKQPAMFKFLRSIGAAMKEDNPGGGQLKNSGPKDRVSTLYPDS